MSEELNQPASIAPGPHHVHKSVIWVWTLRGGLKSAIILFISLLSGFGSIDFALLAMNRISVYFLIFLGIVVLSLALSFGYSYITYKRFTWEITDSELHVRRGIFFKKNVHIPYLRIHSLDSTAKPLDRILGLVTLNVQTPGSAAPEATLSGLKLHDAEALRAEIFSRKRRVYLAQQAGADASASTAQGIGNAVEGLARDAAASALGSIEQFGNSLDSVVAAKGRNINAELGNISQSIRGAFGGEAFLDEAPVEFEYKLDNRELLYSAISGASVTAAFVTLLSVVLPVLGSLIPLIGEIDFFSGMSILAITLLLIGAALLLSIIIWLLSAASSFLNIGGFCVRRRGGRIEVEKGLLSRHFNGVALDRIQSVVVKEGFVRRLIGYAEIRLTTVSTVGDNGKGNNLDAGGVLIHPFIRKNEVKAFLDAILPEYADVPQGEDVKSLPGRAAPRALRRYFFWPCLFSLIPCLIAAMVLDEYIMVWLAWMIPLACVLIYLPAILTGHLYVKNARYGIRGNMLMLRKGSYGLSTSYTFRRRIQFVTISANPFQRRQDLASIKALTAAGDSSVLNSLTDVELAEAERIQNWIKPHGDKN